MHVEVDDGDAFESARERMRGADRDIVEQAESHRRAARGVMARRAHRAERARGTAIEQRVDRGADRARGAQRGFERIGRHHRIGVELRVAVVRRGVAHEINQRRVVHARELFERRARRFDAVEHRETVVIERFEHSLQARRRFGMTGSRRVTQTRRMCVKQGRHEAR